MSSVQKTIIALTDDPFWPRLYRWLVKHVAVDLRAAFEQVTSLIIPRLGSETVVNVRSSQLPARRPSKHNYDPSDHRRPNHPIKDWMAYFNVLRTLFGAGVLCMPLAISQAGIILGPLLAFSTGILVIHTHLLLLKCLHEISRQLKVPYISYRYGFRMALLHGPPIFHCIGERGPGIIATFMVLSQLGICVVYVIMTCDSLRDIMDWDSIKPAMMILLLPYLLMQYFMKTLSIVSYVAMTGNIMNMLGLIVAFYQVFEDPHGKVIMAATEAIPILFAFGSFLFVFSAIGVSLAMDIALKDPRVMTKQCGVIRVGIMVPTVVLVIFGTLGYWSFGTMEDNFLRALPCDEYTSMVCIGFYLVAVACAYPIQCHPAIEVISEVVKYYNPDRAPSATTLSVLKHISRPIFVAVSFLVCYCVPFQGPFVAFVGNLCTTLLALVFPAAMDICLRYPDGYGNFNIILIKNIAIIAIGLTSWIFGVILCGYLLYIRVLAMESPNFENFF